MAGIQSHHIRGISDHQARGTGDLNWELIAKYLAQRIVGVWQIGEWNDEEQIKGVIKFLQKKAILD